MNEPRKILIIQTAFIGDVILATPVIEALHTSYPENTIDFLLRKGNEQLLKDHPKINKLLIWNKKDGKYKNLYQIIKLVRNEKYDIIINLQRFASTGIITSLSGAEITIGFKNNPMSLFFTYRIKHRWGNFVHETERNLDLLQPILGSVKAKMVLYPDTGIFKSVSNYQQPPYVCIAPTSVWFTKQFPIDKWIEFLDLVPKNLLVYLLGASSDSPACEKIIRTSIHKNITNLCGKLNLLQSAALMQGALMNYVNDSAPLHLASAMNAPVTAVFCSTVPKFGFGPLSDHSTIIEISEMLPCRPCGMHGFKACPKKHYKCGYNIDVNQLLKSLDVENQNNKEKL
jgi:ADP-heptose:LPS heptosyltransferase